MPYFVLILSRCHQSRLIERISGPVARVGTVILNVRSGVCVEDGLAQGVRFGDCWYTPPSDEALAAFEYLIVCLRASQYAIRPRKSWREGPIDKSRRVDVQIQTDNYSGRLGCGNVKAIRRVVEQRNDSMRIVFRDEPRVVLECEVKVYKLKGVVLGTIAQSPHNRAIITIDAIHGRNMTRRDQISAGCGAFVH